MNELEYNPNIVFLTSSYNNLMVCSVLKGISLSINSCQSNLNENFETTIEKVETIAPKFMSALNLKVFEKLLNEAHVRK